MGHSLAAPGASFLAHAASPGGRAGGSAAQRARDRVVSVLRALVLALQAVRGGLAQIAVAAPGRLLGDEAGARPACPLIEREAPLRARMGRQAAGEEHRILERVGGTLPWERQHRMGCVAEQDDPALPPLLEPGTAEEAPLEHLALHRPRDDRLCALVEARELLLELIDRRRDGPAFRFPLHPACDGYEVQQLDRKSTRLNSSHLGTSYAV